MEVSGEVADLMVKEGLQVSETAVKLAGSGMLYKIQLKLCEKGYTYKYLKSKI